MNRIKFLNRLDLKCQELNILELHGAEFKRFYGLNECNPELLTEAEKTERNDYRNMLIGDKELKDKYELWHCLKCFNTKWRTQKVDSLVNNWYKNCELIRGLYE